MQLLALVAAFAATLLTYYSPVDSCGCCCGCCQCVCCPQPPIIIQPPPAIHKICSVPCCCCRPCCCCGGCGRRKREAISPLESTTALRARMLQKRGEKADFLRCQQRKQQKTPGPALQFPPGVRGSRNNASISRPNNPSVDNQEKVGWTQPLPTRNFTHSLQSHSTGITARHTNSSVQAEPNPLNLRSRRSPAEHNSSMTTPIAEQGENNHDRTAHKKAKHNNSKKHHHDKNKQKATSEERGAEKTEDASRLSEPTTMRRLISLRRLHP